MANYPVVRHNDSNQCFGTKCFYSDSYTREVFDLYLTDEITRDRYYNTTHYYRLHSKKPHTQRDYLKYDLHCPECQSLLRVVDGPVNCLTLGLYQCPKCDMK